MTTWKQIYFEAERDAKRTKMSADELCSTTWSFSINQQNPTFYLNGLLVMEMWPPYSLFWELNEDGTLQVNHFPAHGFSRRADWGWTMRNCFVCFQSTGSRPALHAPPP
mmetsp:Transcript_18459/g.50969  ORF Transcript_18459/g.50969 Transcript_18459/m.50969 type:complete len:109 (-) Transcript_18459:24-350(-)